MALADAKRAGLQRTRDSCGGRSSSIVDMDERCDSWIGSRKWKAFLVGSIPLHLRDVSRDTPSA